MFEWKVDITGEDGKPEPITLVFKDYGDVPGRVSRRNIGNIEAQIWASLEWGLTEPEKWPAESNHPGSSIFDELPQREITTMYQAWQRADREKREREQT